MAIARRIVQLVLIAVLLMATTGVGSMASASREESCCDDDDGAAASNDTGADECSPFCLSCPSRTVVPVLAVPAPGVVVLVQRAPTPVLAFVMPSDPPRRGVFHPPRLSLGVRPR